MMIATNRAPSVLEQDYEKMYTPVQSSFTVGKWGVGGSHLHGYVILMKIQENISRLQIIQYFRRNYYNQMVQWKAETKLGHSFNELITRQSINQSINHHAHQSSDPLILY